MEEFNRFVDWAGGQAKAAALLGVTVGAISHIQTGRNGVSKKMARKIVEVAGRRFSPAKLLLGQVAA